MLKSSASSPSLPSHHHSSTTTPSSFSRCFSAPRPLRRLILLGVIITGLFYGLYRYASDTTYGPSIVSRVANFTFCPSTECAALEAASAEAKLCTYCDCSQSPPVWPMPTTSQQGGTFDPATDLHEYVHHLIRDSACQHVFTPIPAAADTLQRDLTPRVSVFGRRPSVYESNLHSLKPGVPTEFIITKTGPRSKISKIRASYFDRHSRAIRDYIDSTNQNGHRDGTPGGSRQIVWIISEDNDVIDPDLVAVLNHYDIPYIYYSFGPVNHWGKAQVNANYRIIHGLLGLVNDGPVISVDDDSLIKSELLDRIWKLNKIVVWPMGNLGPNGWEAPIWENGKIVGFDAWWTERAFPLDAGAFAHNSSLIGNDKPINPPDYWTSDTMGGETEFIELFCNTWDDLERLCDEGEKCHLAWHNWYTIGEEK